jgi:hypothetical protein
MTIAGTISKELIRQVVIEMTTNAPKNFRGVKLDKTKGRNPTITENALMTMPLPEVASVTSTASL